MCGYLETQGIRAVYDKGGIAGLVNTWSARASGSSRSSSGHPTSKRRARALASLQENA